MEESEYISKVFDISCKTAETGWEAAAWASEKNQQFLFSWCLSFIGDLKDQTILDVGCGQADLFSFLNGYENYKGIDISSEMVKKAKEKYPGVDVEVCDVDEYQTMHDWVVGIGPFNLDAFYNTPKDDPMGDAFKKSYQMDYLHTCLTNMYRLAKKGVLVTILSDSLVDEKQPGLFYYETTRVVQSITKITNRFVLDQMTAPTQFLVYIPKDIT